MLSKRVRRMLEDRVEYPLTKPARGIKVDEIIKLSSNESPLGPSPKVVEAIKRESGRVGNYPDPKSKELKRVIGEYLDVDASQVAVGNGSDELVDLVCKAFMDLGDEVLIPIPTFSQYEIACRVNGGEPRFVELPDFEWRAEPLVRALSEVRLAFISRPNNPTGNAISEKGLGELLDTGRLVVVDEAYAEFAGYSVVGMSKKYDNLLVLRTFSKAFGLAGLRIGYAVGSEELIGALDRVRAPFNVSVLAQVAGVAALSDKRFLRRVRNVVKDGRKYITEELKKLGLQVLPSDTNFVMANVTPLDTDAPTLCDYLARQGILIRDLSGFRGAGPDWVRISVGTPRQNKLLVMALKEFGGGPKK
jgi:histidinol-phosphate aminotransferase